MKKSKTEAIEVQRLLKLNYMQYANIYFTGFKKIYIFFPFDYVESVLYNTRRTTGNRVSQQIISLYVYKVQFPNSVD